MEKVLFEIGKDTEPNSLRYLLHQSGNKTEIVNGGQPVSQQFLTFKQILKIGCGIISAGIAVTIGVNRSPLCFINGFSDVLSALHGEECAVPRNPSRQRAIEQVNTPADTFYDIFR